MEIIGEQIIPTSQQRVWEALNDPQILKACIAGCESIEKTADNEYKIAMTAAVGPVKAKFNGKLLLGDLNPPSSYSLSFEGSGGAAGFGKGTAKVNLEAQGATATRLAYNANAQVGGKLAQVGARLIDGVAKKMADDFFKKFNATVAPAATVNQVAPAATVSQVAPAAAAGSIASSPPASFTASFATPALNPPLDEATGLGGNAVTRAPMKAEVPAAFNPLWIVATVIVAMILLARMYAA